MLTLPIPITLGAGNPVEHVVNHPWYVTHAGVWVWSAQVGNLVLSALIVIPMMMMVARNVATGPESMGTDRYLPRGRLANMIEVICVYLRDNTIRPLLGDRADRFLPFLLTLFFFVLVNNLLGLLPIADLLGLVFHFADPALAAEHRMPIGSTATQSLFVTGALALIAALVINISGVRALGIGGYLAHLTAGTKFPISLLLVPIEIAGSVIKPVALAIRLFANMTAGHILLATLFMFAGMGLTTIENRLIGVPVTLISALGSAGVYVLETGVALLQAFVFMFLTAVFIAQLAPHADHGHDGAHGHDGEHGHAKPAHA